MGSVLTENPKGGIAEDFGTIQRGGGGGRPTNFL